MRVRVERTAPRIARARWCRRRLRLQGLLLGHLAGRVWPRYQQGHPEKLVVSAEIPVWRLWGGSAQWPPFGSSGSECFLADCVLSLPHGAAFAARQECRSLPELPVRQQELVWSPAALTRDAAGSPRVRPAAVDQQARGPLGVEVVCAGCWRLGAPQASTSA